MPLGMEEGLDPGNFVLAAPSSPKGGDPLKIYVYGPFLFWPNVWMHQDVTWYGGRPQLRELWLDGDAASSPKKGGAPIFGPCLLQPNGCMDQDATWYGGRPRPRRQYVGWRPSSPPQKGGEAALPNSRPIGLRVLWLNGCMDQDDTWHGGGP